MTFSRGLIFLLTFGIIFVSLGVRVKIKHKWDVSLEGAKEIQVKLKDRVIVAPLDKKIETVGGCDVAYNGKKAYVSLIVMDIKRMEVVKEYAGVYDFLFPYISGYFTFREGFPITRLFETIDKAPDITIFDAQGIAHPRGIGLASHIGVIFDIPTIGCAKKPLYGTYEEIGKRRGSYTPLFSNGKKVGEVLRTRDNVSPVYTSPGHRVNFEDVREIILRLTEKHKIPEPLRISDKRSRRLRDT